MAGSTKFVTPSELSPARRARLLAETHTRMLRARTPDLDRHDAWFQLVSQELFEDALMRERKRADRFDQTFVLILMGVNGRGVEWAPVIDAVSQIALDTDVIGWFEQDAVLGLIRPLTDVAPRETARLLG